MLPGLDSISAAAVLERLPLIKYRNAHGSHIYIRPSGEHRFTALDDLNEVSLAKLWADGFKPCVVETSAGNFQAWSAPAIFCTPCSCPHTHRLPKEHLAKQPLRFTR